MNQCDYLGKQTEQVDNGSTEWRISKTPSNPRITLAQIMKQLIENTVQ